MLNKIFIQTLAQTEQTILLTGATGTGKSYLAEKIHRWSTRAQKPFIVINLGCSHENLIDSELFGHERGAFSGADSKRTGKLELANGGTVFLDEIGELPIRLQTKLLRLLNEQVISPMGSNRDTKLDLRIICATNKNLQKSVADGSFRSDLYYRINTCQVDLPNLNTQMNRLEEIAQDTLAQVVQRQGRGPSHLSPEFMQELKRYSWPGNFRELKNALDYAVAINPSGPLSLADLPTYIRHATINNPAPLPLPASNTLQNINVAEVTDYYEWKSLAEKEFLANALKRFNGRINLTAKKTNISKVTLIEKIKKYSICVEGIKAANYLSKKQSEATQ